jgi:hypothetical protein
MHARVSMWVSECAQIAHAYIRVCLSLSVCVYQDALRAEKEWFNSHPVYKAISSRLGTSFLSKRLNTILLAHIQRTLVRVCVCVCVCEREKMCEKCVCVHTCSYFYTHLHIHTQTTHILIHTYTTHTYTTHTFLHTHTHTARLETQDR